LKSIKQENSKKRKSDQAVEQRLGKVKRIGK